MNCLSIIWYLPLWEGWSLMIWKVLLVFNQSETAATWKYKMFKQRSWHLNNAMLEIFVDWSGSTLVVLKTLRLYWFLWSNSFESGNGKLHPTHCMFQVFCRLQHFDVTLQRIWRFSKKAIEWCDFFDLWRILEING